LLEYVLSHFASTNSAMTLAYDYSSGLVFLSVATAMFGSALALYLTEIMHQAKSLPTRRMVQVSGAIAFGGAVWSMHFFGMLAFELCVSVSYDPWLTLASSLPAVLAAWVAMNFMGKDNQTPNQTVQSGALIGAGIGLMHFTGMEAMQMDAVLRYDPSTFAFAVASAIVLSIISLFLINKIKQNTKRHKGDIYIFGGVGFGLAISAMHYLGMLAARFVGDAETDMPVPATDHLYLSILILLGLLALLGNVFSGSLIIKSSNRLELLNEQKAELEANHEQLKQQQSVMLKNEKLVTLGTLSAGIAHEINNPLSFVSGNLNMLQEYIDTLKKVSQQLRDWHAEGKLSPEQKEIYEKLAADIDLEFVEEDIDSLLYDTLDGSRRITSIVTNLRGFARTESRDRLPTDLNEGIRSTLRLLKSAIGNNQSVELDLQELPSVCCNPNEINQIFVNLIVNASQAIADDGIIWISSCTLKDEVVVRIKDNGPGMSEEVREKIFDPFFTTKPPGEGTGMGLSIAHNIVESHDGTLEVTSTEGRGTTFELRLPIYDGVSPCGD